MNVILKKLKHPQLVLAITALLIYGIILFFFGWPFVDKSLTQGQSLGYAAKDTKLTAILFLVQKYLSIAGCVFLIAAVLLTESIEYQFRHIMHEPEARKVRLTAKVMLGAFILAYFGVLTCPILNFINMILAKEPVFRELSRGKFVRETGLGLIILVGTYGIFIYGKNLLTKRPSSLIAGCYLWQYSKLILKKDIDAAKIAVGKACEIDPTGVVPWVARAMFHVGHLNEYEKAETYFETAMHNLILTNDLSEKEHAEYEYCRGVMLLGKNDIDEAIKAIELSLKLNYNSDRAKFLDKLRQRQKRV